jgi:membrane protease YdiL (CAAX protease family)
MAEVGPTPLQASSPLARAWGRLPLVVQAVVSGFLAFWLVGSLVGLAILALVPLPWSIAVLAVALAVYLAYVSGRRWHDSTQAWRAVRFRAVTLPTRVWGWSLLAALLGVAAGQAGLVVALRLFGFSAEAWTFGVDLTDVPTWQAWSVILMAALLAGVTEEVGFRGYMQVPLEKRYGPAASIALVSLVFVIVHLPQAWAGGIILVVLFAWSATWGILAFASGSLIPAMLSHTLLDVINFSYWWTDVAGTFDERPISETGIDVHFVIWLLILLATLVLFAWAVRRTLAVRQGA